MQDILNALLADYRLGRPIDGDSSCCFPQAERIPELIDTLRSLLFPGFFRDGLLCAGQDTYISMRLGAALCDLEGMISLLCPDAAQISRQFLGDFPTLRQLLQLDLQAFLAGDPAAESEAQVITCYPGYYAVTVYRLAHQLRLLGVPVLPRMMAEQAHSRTGIDIHPGARIGASFFIDHGTGVVIGETAVIGEQVKIYQGVTLGALSTRGGSALRGKKRHPTIEDGVTVYANATILGGNTVIGRGSVIGGSAFITDSLPPFSRCPPGP